MNVSIHALLAECDRNLTKTGIKKLGFNPRTPCGVRRAGWLRLNPLTRFQSTHSLRSATRQNRKAVACGQFQSTHSLRSATRPASRTIGLGKVSIHALLAECDNISNLSMLLSGRFNPRTPCGVRPVSPISPTITHCFNPRTPCGVRLRPTLYIATQQSKSYFAPTSLKRPSLHGCSF